MDEFVIASKKKPVIGTYALSTCLSLIIYDKHGNYTLCHILNNYEKIIKRMLDKLINDAPLNVIIIPGYDTVVSKIYEVIEHLKNHQIYMLHDFEIEIKYLKNYYDKNTESVEFAFDTRTKKFIKPNYNEIFLKRG